MILGSAPDEREFVHAGSTRGELMQSLGPPLRTQAVSPPRRAWDLRESDPQVSLLVYPSHGFDADRGSFPIPPGDLAVSEASYAVRARSRDDARRAQAGFDSFMTLGLAEIWLVPSALVERMSEEQRLLTVWFDAAGVALAYKSSAVRGP